MHLLIDFSRVLLFPKDPAYDGTLNGLYKLHRGEPNFHFYDYFVLNGELLAFLSKTYSRDSCSIFTSDIIQDDVAVRAFIDPLFADIFSAQALGLEKKDPNAYRQVVELLQEQPSQVPYVDDNESNCLAASASGLNVHWYRSNESLSQALKETHARSSNGQIR
jgi:FMN phosphatase YigB (HAD superfamily)